MPISKEFPIELTPEERRSRLMVAALAQLAKDAGGRIAVHLEKGAFGKFQLVLASDPEKRIVTFTLVPRKD